MRRTFEPRGHGGEHGAGAARDAGEARRAVQGRPHEQRVDRAVAARVLGARAPRAGEDVAAADRPGEHVQAVVGPQRPAHEAGRERVLGGVVPRVGARRALGVLQRRRRRDGQLRLAGPALGHERLAVEQPHDALGVHVPRQRRVQRRWQREPHLRRRADRRGDEPARVAPVGGPGRTVEARGDGDRVDRGHGPKPRTRRRR